MTTTMKKPQKLSMEPNVAKTAKDNIGTGAMEFVSCADESRRKRTYLQRRSLCWMGSDGGMLVPAVIPYVSIETLKDKWSKLSYPELCYEIMRLYIAESEIPNADLKDIILNNRLADLATKGLLG